MGLIKSSTGMQPARISLTDHTPTRWSDIVAERKSTHPNAAPIKRLLDTTELLEAVLGYLPPKDMLIMHRLCKRVRDVIKASSPLQTGLFFRASKDKNAETWAVDSDGNLHVGKAALEALSKPPTLGKQPLDLKPVICNPLILNKYWPDHLSNLETRLDYFRRHRPASLEYFKLKYKKLAVAASCRSMFLTQPPVTTVDVEIQGMRRYAEWEDRRGLPKWFEGTIARVKVENPAGVTLGDVLKVGRYDGWIRNLTFPDNFVVMAEIKKLVKGC